MTKDEIRAKITTIMADFMSDAPAPSAETRAAVLDLVTMVFNDLHAIAENARDKMMPSAPRTLASGREQDVGRWQDHVEEPNR